MACARGEISDRRMQGDVGRACIKAGRRRFAPRSAVSQSVSPCLVVVGVVQVEEVTCHEVPYQGCVFWEERG